MLTEVKKELRAAEIRKKVAESKNLSNGERRKLLSFLLEFVDVFALSTSQFRAAKLPPFDIDVQGAKPIKTPLRRTSPIHRAEIARQVKALLEAGLIKVANSPWSSAVVLVKKSKGWRLCCNFRAKNALSEGTVFARPLPRVDDALESTGGSRYMSIFDACAGFNQCPNSEERKRCVPLEHPTVGITSGR